MKKTLLAGLATGLFTLGLASMANALPIFSDNFEGDTVGLNKNNFINWNVSGGTVDLIGTGTSWDYFPSYGKYVDMDGSSGNAGIITTSTTIALNAGSYLLQFDLAGNQRGNQNDTVVVNVNIGFSNYSYSLNAFDPFQTFTQYFTVAALSNITLSFEGLGGDNIGMLLDNVQVNAVPEPGTMFLFGAGILGLSAVARRKRS